MSTTGTAKPSIDVKKLISVDGGLTYKNADSPPYPILVSPKNPMYKFIVTNTGDVQLSLVSLSDSDFGPITVGGILEPGASFEVTKTGEFTSGKHCNTATVSGTYIKDDHKKEVKDSDKACYIGAKPSIAIEKYISVDNKETWLKADTPPGPLLPDGVTPHFKFVITNNGDVTLENISVTDSVLGVIGSLPSLDTNASFEWIV